jgi:hypothetical protein
MVERRRCKRFPLESMQEVFICGEFNRQNLEGDIAIQDDIPSEVHDAHSPRAERLDDAVMAEACAARQTTVEGRDTARTSRFVHEMAQGVPEKAAKTIIVGKKVIYHATEFRDIAASSIQKGSSLLRWQIENDSEELLGGLLKIGHGCIQLVMDLAHKSTIPATKLFSSDVFRFQ